MAAWPFPRTWTLPEALGPGAGEHTGCRGMMQGMHRARYAKALVELMKMGALLGWISS